MKLSHQIHFKPELKELEFRLNSLLSNPGILSPSSIKNKQDSYQNLSETFQTNKQDQTQSQTSRTSLLSPRYSVQSSQTKSKISSFSVFNKPEFSIDRQKGLQLKSTIDMKQRNANRVTSSFTSPRSQDKETKESKHLKPSNEISENFQFKHLKVPRESTQLNKNRTDLEQSLTESKLIELNYLINLMKEKDLQSLPQMQVLIQIF